jgi:glycosyltransferase involved in cell wall biosynthesis
MNAAKPFKTHYVACSRYVKDTIERSYGLSPHQVSVIYNGIDIERFAAVRRPRAQGLGVGEAARLKIGMVASLERSKDQGILLHALSILEKTGHDVELHLIGGGEREGYLRALSVKLGVGPRIVWKGTVADVPSALRELDVFVYAAKQEEGFGIALIEALAAGLPIVASDVGACREVLADSKLGALVKPDDPAAWAVAIRASVGRPPVALSSLEPFDIRHAASSYLSLLDEIKTR